MSVNDAIDQLVWIVWEDIEALSSWADNDAVEEFLQRGCPLFNTWGKLIGVTPDGSLVVASTAGVGMSSGYDVGDVTKIPVSVIHSARVWAVETQNWKDIELQPKGLA